MAIPPVQIRITAPGAQTAAAAVRNVAADVRTLGTEGDRAGQRFSGLATALSVAGGRAIYEAGRQIKLLASEAVRAADQTAKAAAKSGMSAGEYQRLAYAARLSGASMEQVQVAVRTLQVQVAQSGEAIQGLGLNLSQLNAMAPDQQFLAVASAIASIQNPAQRTLAAVRAFGARSGPDLLPMIMGLRTLREEADRLGLVLSDRALKAAEGFNDAIARLKMQAQSKIVIAVEFLTTQKQAGELGTVGRQAGLGAVAGGLVGGLIGARVGGAKGAMAGAKIGAKVGGWGAAAGQLALNWMQEGRKREVEEEIASSDVVQEARAEEARRAAMQAAANARREGTDQRLATAAAADQERAERTKAAERDAQEDVYRRLLAAEHTGVADPNAQRLMDVGVKEWTRVGGGDARLGVRWMEERWKAEEKAADEYRERRNDIERDLATAEDALADARQAASEDRTRAWIAAQREQAQERIRAARDVAAAERAALDSLRSQFRERWGDTLPTPRRVRAQAREDRTAERERDREQAAFDRRLASARARQAELVNNAGLSPAQAIARLSAPGRAAIESDDDRRALAIQERRADAAARAEQSQQAESERIMADLRRRELDLGRQRVAVERELVNEIASLRAQLAQSPMPQAKAPPATPPPSPPAAPTPERRPFLQRQPLPERPPVPEPPAMPKRPPPRPENTEIAEAIRSGRASDSVFERNRVRGIPRRDPATAGPVRSAAPPTVPALPPPPAAAVAAPVASGQVPAAAPAAVSPRVPIAADFIPPLPVVAWDDGKPVHDVTPPPEFTRHLPPAMPAAPPPERPRRPESGYDVLAGPFAAPPWHSRPSPFPSGVPEKPASPVPSAGADIPQGKPIAPAPSRDELLTELQTHTDLLRRLLLAGGVT